MNLVDLDAGHRKSQSLQDIDYVKISVYNLASVESSLKENSIDLDENIWNRKLLQSPHLTTDLSAQG